MILAKKNEHHGTSEVPLDIGTTLNSFQSNSSLPVLMEGLKREDMDGETASGKVCSIHAGCNSIRSCCCTTFHILKQGLSL